MEFITLLACGAVIIFLGPVWVKHLIETRLEARRLRKVQLDKLKEEE